MLPPLLFSPWQIIHSSDEGRQVLEKLAPAAGTLSLIAAQETHELPAEQYVVAFSLPTNEPPAPRFVDAPAQHTEPALTIPSAPPQLRQT